ncbi:MAG: hypothetical protein AVDCRST_MAG56-5706 [uncultured Cytophagales bacterium]|uniref:Uncharacterized protein n=1 Tax=uncultured Cytophagales bacterium TaxID=158755 RepID=A0A6J4KH55_9SPHI|nr:MAG: hypothetical protein AVDCRST_MAG56-5706 [uncultured Cytophagales bacterium]
MAAQEEKTFVLAQLSKQLLSARPRCLDRDHREKCKQVRGGPTQ